MACDPDYYFGLLEPLTYLRVLLIPRVCLGSKAFWKHLVYVCKHNLCVIVLESRYVIGYLVTI